MAIPKEKTASLIAKANIIDRSNDWWDELPLAVRLGINESIEQANRSEFISFDEVKKEVSALLKNAA